MTCSYIIHTLAQHSGCPLLFPVPHLWSGTLPEQVAIDECERESLDGAGLLAGRGFHGIGARQRREVKQSLILNLQPLDGILYIQHESHTVTCKLHVHM